MMCCLGVDVLWDVRGECGGGIRARVGADGHGRHLGLGQQLGQSAGPGAHASCAHPTAHLLAGRQEYQTGERQKQAEYKLVSTLSGGFLLLSLTNGYKQGFSVGICHACA